MSATAAANTAKDVAVEVGKVAAREAAFTAVEVVAAVAVLTVFGLAANKLHARRTKKALAEELE